ncbi:MAG TPA: CHASE4 domain-containing protein [Methanoregula sp.]|nr:CHASE4 domain-containing protein [Methanoregula sp.]
MDLRKKTLGILTGVIIGIIIIFMVISFTFFLDNYRKMETGYVTDYSNLVLQNVQNEMNNLDMIVKDWGPWDDTYAFVAGEKPDYVAVNLGKPAFQNLRMNFILITNNQGDILYGEGYDLEKQVITPLRPDIVAELSREGSTLRNLVTTSQPGGFLNLPQGPVILSTYPVLHSDYTGPSRGVVMIGRFLTEAETAKFAYATQAKVSIIPLEQALLSQQDRNALSEADSTQLQVRTLDEDTLEANWVIQDISETGKFVISLKLPRDIYQQGKRDILIFVLLQLGIGLAIGLITIRFLDKQILNRLATINSDIDDITLHKTGRSHIRATGNDEIAHLGLAMNTMIDQIDRDKKELKARELRFREFAEQFPEVMLETDNGLNLTFINTIASEKFGYTQDDLKKNVKILNFIAQEDHVRAEENFSRVLKGLPPSGNDYIMIKKDGSRFPVLLYSAPVIMDEKIVGVRIFAGDISARKQMEKNLLETNRILNLLSRVTRNDISSQLLTLFGYMDLVEETSFEPEKRGYFNKMKQSAENIRQQISFTRDFQDIGVKAPQWQNVKQVILNANGNHDTSRYRVLIDIQDVEVYADKLLERVFYNLVDYANKFGGAISEIRMSALETPEGFRISLEHDGAGIPEEKKEDIFKEGYFGNTEFGLFLSREILALSGITIRETGDPDKGTRFWILVPVNRWRKTCLRQTEY